ncbi:unnamed protein product [Adineta steineri]|uniref:Uncharacterized protein n=1 Tax=Adineta steineri TaxID=433720 RepID=A0A818URU0_9BILA|nr:unnamed protein product [Adineta steineri]
MSEVVEIDSFYGLIEEIKDMVETLNKLKSRIELRLHENSSRNCTQHVCLIREFLDIRKSVKTICDALIDHRLSEPSITMSYIWCLIESYSTSPEAVREGTHLLDRFFKLKMHSMIKPTSYYDTIVAYVKWQNETVQYFVNEFKKKPKTERLNEIEQLWNWNYRTNEGIFFGGAARPLHLKKVTEFASIMSIYYDRLWPLYKENRSTLVDALNTLLHEESRIYWPDYEIFPCTASTTIMDKCLQYFFFKNRHNTWFINSSASDYIPFVNSAREIFAEKFNGSNMNLPNQHNTEWILKNLKQRCLNIYNQNNNNNGIDPIIIILLTSKNRYGERIDVDSIHLELSQYFSTIVTIVDGCQDGQAFTNVDIVIYSKRFMQTGAIGLVNRTFLEKNPPLHKKLSLCTNFPIGILAQIYININMMNNNIAHGVEDLVNSSWWHFSECPIRYELHSVIDDSYIQQDRMEYIRSPIRYSFTKDLNGTILMLTTNNNGHVILPKLWALLKKQGHSADCFVMDNPYLKSNNGIRSDKVRELISEKFISELRQLETLSSDYLVWPLVPYWVSESNDISVEQLNQHFEICRDYHCYLRISLGRCSYPGKLKRFIEHIDNIFERNELDVSDDVIGKHSSQWPT